MFLRDFGFFKGRMVWMDIVTFYIVSLQSCGGFG